MKKWDVEYAVKRAKFALYEWNDRANFFEGLGACEHEIDGIVENAVHCGIQMALTGKIKFDIDGNVVKSDYSRLKKQNKVSM